MGRERCPACGDSGWVLEIVLDRDAGLIDSVERDCDSCAAREGEAANHRTEATAATRRAA